MFPKRLSLALLALLLVAIDSPNPAWQRAPTVFQKPGFWTSKDSSLGPAAQDLDDGTLIEQSLFRKQYPRADLYEITYMSDGLRVKGFLARPTAAGVYPGVVVNHGGLGSIANPERVALFAQAGYVAIGPHYRGNSGSEGIEDYGRQDVHDVLNAIKVLESLDYVDASRLGMWGVSHGGQMTLLAIAQGAPVHAAVTWHGVTDVEALVEFNRASGDAGLGNDELMRVIGATPEEDPEAYAWRSPIRFVDKINVPLLVIHGADDRAVPLAQSETLVAALQARGATVDLRVYPGQGHMFRGWAHTDAWTRTLAWFARYVRGQP
ncbi:MAG TPA: prolyl oligopeptidase family serine peptidase [Anaerolineae bacterium]|nr:prolyl oligopeptidase family serine peptidase [Anaerolineae bacterium]